jgi:hypothetical protein
VVGPSVPKRFVGATGVGGASIRDNSVRAAATEAAVIRTPCSEACAFASSIEMFWSLIRMLSAARTGGLTCL